MFKNAIRLRPWGAALALALLACGCSGHPGAQVAGTGTPPPVDPATAGSLTVTLVKDGLGEDLAQLNLAFRKLEVRSGGLWRPVLDLPAPAPAVNVLAATSQAPAVLASSPGVAWPPGPCDALRITLDPSTASLADDSGHPPRPGGSGAVRVPHGAARDPHRGHRAEHRAAHRVQRGPRGPGAGGGPPGAGHLPAGAGGGAGLRPGRHRVHHRAGGRRRHRRGARPAPGRHGGDRPELDTFSALVAPPAAQTTSTLTGTVAVPPAPGQAVWVDLVEVVPADPSQSLQCPFVVASAPVAADGSFAFPAADAQVPTGVYAAVLHTYAPGPGQELVDSPRSSAPIGLQTGVPHTISF